MNFDELTDEQLLSIYRKERDIEVYTVLFRRYTSMIYGVLLKYLQDKTASSDAVMDIFEQLSSSVLRYDIKVFRVWLYSCVKNHAMKVLKESSRHRTEEIGVNIVEFCDDFTLDNVVKSEERYKKLEECIDTLPPAQSKAVKMFFIDELSYKDIEDSTEFTFKQIKSFIQNGKRNIRICLEKKGVIE